MANPLFFPSTGGGCGSWPHLLLRFACVQLYASIPVPKFFVHCQLVLQRTTSDSILIV